MLKNYLKIAWRNLVRNKVYSLINILGLSIGMASCMLILIWIQNEVSHDQFHEKKDRIFIANNSDVNEGVKNAWAWTPNILAPTLKQDYPEVEDAIRVDDYNSFLFTVGDKKQKQSGAFTDPGFLTTFSFPLKQGDPQTALNETYNIVLTEKLAKNLFGDGDAMGKIIKIDSADNFTVSGILKDLPGNTRFDFDYLLPWDYSVRLGWRDSSWGNNSLQTFVLLKEGVSHAAFDQKIKSITKDHLADNPLYKNREVFTQPLTDAWLYSKQENGQYTGGRIEMVRLFSIIAVFILVIACINFMNLSTARSEKRAKEVGIRKVVGAQKGLLIGQFLGESILLACIAFVFALAIVFFTLPPFGNLVNKTLSIDFANPLFWLLSLSFIVICGLLAGSYPAFYLSAFNPVKVLKGLFKRSNAAVNPRKVLVVLQFSFAIILIISTIIVSQQIKYAQSRDNGYDRTDLVYFQIEGAIDGKYELIRNELISKGAAVAVTKSMSPITTRYSDSWGWSWTGSTEEDKRIDFVRMASDADFVKTMGAKLVMGRDIDIYKFPGDSTSIVLNETAAKMMHLDDPLSTILKADGMDWTVVGVVKDFIYESPYDKVQQLVVFGPKSWFSTIHFRLNPANPTSHNLAVAEQVLKTYNPDYPFEYHFVDEAYARKFQEEQRVGTLAALFAGLTIFISCLGLFGLATFTAESRIKEVGVRKVLGASVFSVTVLLSKDFLKLVFISFVIASPVAWYAMNKWLAGYTYNVGVAWWVFLLAGVLSILISLLTISYQAIKAAVANPVNSLRDE
ncbi:ABC transporter permease [Parapedobacter sp. DT-150]|uniref:ABC transporter permease n=1 Tax=Parapedobacter sp. DT-150 TaxID=3396162 RepID=UPI003F1A61A1